MSTTEQVQHTPGRWWASAFSNVVGCGVMAQPDPNRNAGSVALVHGRTREETEANALLMAAAPDGLQAAKLAVGCFDVHGVVDDESIAALRAFIAAATTYPRGEES